MYPALMTHAHTISLYKVGRTLANNSPEIETLYIQTAFIYIPAR